MRDPGHTFCTVITRSHLHWALALNESLREQDPGVRMRILVTDAGPFTDERLAAFPNTGLLYLDDLADQAHVAALRAKYPAGSDPFRWSFKPVLMLHLLDQFERVLFCDCDLHFFNDTSCLLEALGDAAMLLSPHWWDPRADRDPYSFYRSFGHGHFNSGLVGAGQAGREALRLWARNCLAVCAIDPAKGQFGDQTHLVLLPVFFEGIAILRHRGCNLATWNRTECARTAMPDGTVRINGVFPVVFVHFTGGTIRDILRGTDALLMPFLERFRDALARYQPGYDIVAETRQRWEERRRRQWLLRLWRRAGRRVARLLGTSKPLPA